VCVFFLFFVLREGGELGSFFQVLQERKKEENKEGDGRRLKDECMKAEESRCEYKTKQL
jgi:hypothetical protein